MLKLMLRKLTGRL